MNSCYWTKDAGSVAPIWRLALFRLPVSWLSALLLYLGLAVLLLSRAWRCCSYLSLAVLFLLEFWRSYSYTEAGCVVLPEDCLRKISPPSHSSNLSPMDSRGDLQKVQSKNIPYICNFFRKDIFCLPVVYPTPSMTAMQRKEQKTTTQP